MARDGALLVIDAAGFIVGWSQEARSVFERDTGLAVGVPVVELLSAAWARVDAGSDDRSNTPAAVPGLVVRPVALRDGRSGWGVYLLPPEDEGETSRDQALLKALFTQSPIGIQVLDPDLRILRVNTTAATGMSTFEPADLLGRHLFDVIQPSDLEEVVAMMHDVLATGRPALDRLVRGRPPNDPAHEHVYSASVFRLQDADGRVLGVSTAAVDVTVRERALARARVLNEVRERMGQTLELDTTCGELVDVLVPAFADAAEVDLFDPVLRGEDPPSAPVEPDIPLRRMSFASTDRQGDSLGIGTGPFRFPAAWLQALTDAQPHLITYQSDETTDHRPPESRAPRPSGPHSAIVTPMTLRNGVLGILSLYRCPDRDPFVDEDLDLALDVAARTSLHIDNARRYAREHTIALTLQRRLLAQLPVPQAAVESAHFHHSADAGGGWFDVFPLSGARIALTVGRVSGTGIHAAMAMGQLRTAIHTLASLDLEPDELLARLNGTVTRLAAERVGLPTSDPLRSQALTADCLYGIYDPLTLSCTIALAGGPQPVLAYPDGTVETADVPLAPPLGGGEGTFASTRLGLPEGGIIALYTNTLLPTSEVGKKAARDRLRQTLSPSTRPLIDLRDEVVRTVPASSLGADAVLLLVRTQTLRPSLVATWDLPVDPSAVATARARTRRQLTEWNLDELLLTTELIVSELATNAVRYGTPPIILRLINGGRTLTFEVSDSSPVSPHLRHAQTSDEGGRGLFICAELAQNWGVRFSDSGKTIWTEQECPTGHS
ncbi:SpoIIE family protein phosphatase [Streptomyces rhizosphaerihabitans]|uniref:SpoIIE family protein phosphatase n=1 Tax=Streptomyces rhizosphaerihabitans TaxID=1266770 RepID=UPI0021C23AB8|nr:SpoIIE family protein phosphatase [Streptomyces rhizosphaerihabitans]MCT9003564.1 SpoIIE family protein phosphatase [Streptomyces rhizosphaerihabitans]